MSLRFDYSCLAIKEIQLIMLELLKCFFLYEQNSSSYSKENLPFSADLIKNYLNLPTDIH